MNQEGADSSSRLETLVAVLIAVVTVIGAVVAWRASVADDGAGDADFAGLQAAVNVEETRALNFVNAYEHYGAYTTYQRSNDLGELIELEMEEADDADQELLQSRATDAYDLALANESLFPNRFLERGGGYGLQRELDEMWADAGREKDLNPEPQFAEADALRNKSNLLLAALTVQAVGLVFYTLVESIGSRGRYLMVTLGSLFALAGTVWAIMIEMGG